MLHKKNQIFITESYNSCYGFPKGEKEHNETVEQCAKREFFEETGYNIENTDLSNYKILKTNIENITYIFYVIKVGENFDLNTFPIDDVEITSFGWKRINEIKNLKLSKAVKKIFHQFVKVYKIK